MIPQDNYLEWLKKANEDFDFAASILPDTSFYAQVCFHFQQAAEKYFKSYIVAKKLEFNKIHDLRKLLGICEKYDGAFSSLKEESNFLSPFYIDTRYPVHWPAAVNKKEATEAYEAALKIRTHIENSFKNNK